MLGPRAARPLARVCSRQTSALTVRRFLFSPRTSNSTRATQDFDLNRLNNKRRDYERNRTAFLAAGAVAGIISFIYTAWKLKKALELKAEKQDGSAVKCDSPIPIDTFKTEAGEKRKVVLHDEEGREIVPTGNSTVPVFPRTLDLSLPGTDAPTGAPIAASISDNAGTELTLVGLGMRTVTFLGIQVYLVGFYVATADIERLQHYLVKKINPLATTLIPSEKDALRKALRDPVEGEETWDSLLQKAGCRSAFRIVPVRNTDFHHLRDGFVRAIQSRSGRDKAYGDEAFAQAVRDFKTIFNRGQVPKKKELLLTRDISGKLSVLYGEGDCPDKGSRSVMGAIPDERLSRLLWLNYLAGTQVASDGARDNIIEGIMELVERPTGTVATQIL
ncbi:Chalcone isomerase, subgroup [Moelleriella libera RCEF 2490]|uniref:Chalcone isomerase, subgroup n=1 Tax=Moelleriella libera RCEF 2490 TaxID=1081109 RepID=A0A166PWH6_9HYPO|nr:Chalcone isomerase, subgroup [Moelleriella libera RCEF 2490]